MRDLLSCRVYIPCFHEAVAVPSAHAALNTGASVGELSASTRIIVHHRWCWRLDAQPLHRRLISKEHVMRRSLGDGDN